MCKRVISLILSIALIATMLIGCGETEQKANKKNKNAIEVEISVWDSGLGIEWLEKMIENFNKKQTKYEVIYKASSNSNTVNAALGMENDDTVDIYMTYLATSAYNKYMEPLDDILLNMKAEGESITIGEKFNEAYLLLELKEDGHYYTLPFSGGVLGLFYNKKLFDKAGIKQLPRTTKELEKVCDTLNSKGITPLCHFQGDGYYVYMTEAFMMQYSGKDYYLNNYYQCKDENGNAPNKDVLLQKDGRYYALKAYETFVTPQYTLLGSNTKSHTEIQTEFIYDAAAMMVNGSWISNEMKNVGGMDHVYEMKMPVISSIINRLTTVKNDAQLKKVITAIDQVTDGEKQVSDFASGDGYLVDDVTVSAADWDIISEARNTVASNYAQHEVFIPTYSEAKEGAAEFLRYMYSDEGYQIFAETTQSPLPIRLSTGETVDTSKFSDIAKFQFETVDQALSFVDPGLASKHRIFIDGGAKPMGNVLYISKMSASDQRDRMSADEIWNNITKTIDEYFDDWVENIK